MYTACLAKAFTTVLATVNRILAVELNTAIKVGVWLLVRVRDHEMQHKA